MSHLPAAVHQAARVTAPVALAVAAAAATLQLIGQVGGHARLVQATSGWLVSPLAVFVTAVAVLARRSGARSLRRPTAWMVAALAGCWLGDLTDQVLPKLAAFLVGHLCFCVAWWHWRSAGVLWQRRRRIVAVLIASAVAVGMVALLAPRVGGMIVPMALYATCICTMALLATCLGRAGTVGGALFVVSDALLAIDWFVHPVPMSGLVIMSCYIIAVWLLTLATARRLAAHGHDDRDLRPACGRAATVPGEPELG